KFLKFSIPEAEDAFVEDPKVRNIFDAIKHLEDHGFTDIILVVGEDRVKEFKDKIPQYIGHPDKSKSLNINSFKVVSAGNRDPDADDVTGVSSSKLRDFAATGDFKSF